MSVSRRNLTQSEGVRGLITSAVPLEAENRQVLTEGLNGILGQAEWRFEVNPALLGGLRVKFGNRVYDGSTLCLLQQTRERILAGGQQAEADPEEFLRLALEQLEQTAPLVIEDVGTVMAVGDGVAQISGLTIAMLGELVAFPRENLMGMVMALDDDCTGCVLLGDERRVQEGDEVRLTGRVVEVPVGRALTGRVVDALGNPIDGSGPIATRQFRPIESPAPGIADRQPVNRPLQTGIKLIDALIPIGRGQRELIIGDRQTGKTAIAIDTILNQKGKGVFCFYVSIGQKASTLAHVVQVLQENGAMEYTTVVAASAGEPAPMQYIAPYAGCAMAEELMYHGHDVLVIYDDLSKHAVAYREMSLLLRRPPGREAYPGDIFYLHARLLERAAALHPRLGGGTMTALPVVETMGGDISAYIPTNIISITDGQIFLENDLFFAGIRPAVNVGMSVSRVGGDAQIKAMKKAAGPLKLMLAQYRELASFIQFGADLDQVAKAQLTRGEKLTELLKQDQFTPLEVWDQIVLMMAATRGLLDDIPTDRIQLFEQELLTFIHTEGASAFAGFSAATGDSQTDPDRDQRLLQMICRFKKIFLQISDSTRTGTEQAG